MDLGPVQQTLRQPSIHKPIVSAVANWHSSYNGDADEGLLRLIDRCEEHFRGRPHFEQRLVFTYYAPSTGSYDFEKLRVGWSKAKRSRRYPYGRWRFVLQEEDGVTELLFVSKQERLDIFDTGAFQRLIDLMVAPQA
jgi:hypothetical protein